MTCSTIGLIVGLLAAPAEAPAEAPAGTSTDAVAEASPDDWRIQDPTSNDPTLDWGDDGLTVARPAYGMHVQGVTRTPDGKPNYNLAPKDWHQMVRENPTLHRLNRRSKMLGPGIGALIVGGSWMALSTALAYDGYYAKTATGALFQWGVPAAVLVSGAIMTTVGVAARRDMEREQKRFYMSPYASATAAGAVVSGRF